MRVFTVVAMETRKQQFKSAVSDAIVHLQGREQALAPFGWTGEKAGWIAFVCLHSGAFTRVQCARFLDAHPEQVRRVVHALIAQGLAAEDTVPGIRGIGRVCRIFSRRIYRAIGAEHIRHRRDASPEVLMRRLLSLDYVIEHPGLQWLATEAEKVAALEALGIERGLLPVRLYRAAAGTTRRYFPVKYGSMIATIVPCGPVIFRNACYYNVIRRIMAVFTGSLLCRYVPYCTIVYPSICDTQVGYTACVNDPLRPPSWRE